MIVATFATKLFDQEQRIYPFQRVATVTVATVATDVETSCAACAYVTKFGNFSMPVRAGLSSTFKLVSHAEEWRELLRYCVLSTVEKGFGVSDAVKPLLVSCERALRMEPMPR